MKFPFDEAENTMTITCTHVIKEDKPILYVSHDDEDGMWQFLCGGTHHLTEDAMIVSLYEIYERDKEIGSIADLALGYCAERNSINDKWVIQRQYTE